jgi:hypothetical protein
MIRTSQPLQDGYIECDECGHPVEAHVGGCNEVDGCLCSQRWTVRAIQAIRMREGLPAGSPATWLLDAQ